MKVIDCQQETYVKLGYKTKENKKLRLTRSQKEKNWSSMNNEEKKYFLKVGCPNTNDIIVTLIYSILPKFKLTLGTV
jgi:hypothetical protein